MGETLVQHGYRILTGGSYKAFIDSTYDDFFALARRLYSDARALTDHDDIAQLQNLHFLILKGLVRITEEKAQDGSSSLFLEIVIPSPSAR